MGPWDARDLDEDDATDSGSLAARLQRRWSAGDKPGFYSLLYGSAVPRITAWLRQDHGLAEVEAEECVAAALEGFDRMAAAGTVITHPHAYFRQSAHNAAVMVHRRREREAASVVDYYTSEDGQDPFDIAVNNASLSRWAVVVIEEAMDEDTVVDELWAVDLITAALERLPEQSQRVLGLLARQPFDFINGDFDIQSKQAAAELGMAAPAFRKAKQRAYTRLREVIPALAAELKLALPQRASETIFTEPTQIAVPEDGQ